MRCVYIELPRVSERQKGVGRFFGGGGGGGGGGATGNVCVTPPCKYVDIYRWAHGAGLDT